MPPASSEPRGLRLRTNAKINLYLGVLGRRRDGYHELETIYHGISLADELTLQPSPADITVEMRGEAIVGEIPAHENLVFTAAGALRELAGVKSGAHIEVCKRIPIGAGLGGGSADAAGSLVGLRSLWEIAIGDDELLALAAELGSDVSFCIRGGTAAATGRGEHLTPLPAPATLWFVLGISTLPLATAEVYELWTPDTSTGAAGRAPMARALESGDVGEVAARLHNDLERCACKLRPELAGKKAALLDAGARGCLVSGSGPTVFGICGSAADARRVAARARSSFDRIEIVSSAPTSIQTAQGLPGPGAPRPPAGR